MHIHAEGHPIHSRALAVTLTQRGDGNLAVFGSLLDLRKRGFVPVGSELQGMGIIHHMEIHGVLGCQNLQWSELAATQPTVAFEASEATGGESCRDIVEHVRALRGATLDEHFPATLRGQMGGPLGCSHVLTLLQFVAAAVPWAVQRLDDDVGGVAGFAPGARLFRRDLIIDGYERASGGLAVALQMADLWHTPGVLLRLPADLLGRHDELRLTIDLDGWPAVIAAARGARRSRRRSEFGDAAWVQQDAVLAGLLGVSLGRGAGVLLTQKLSSEPGLRDALLMLGPALIQCRAAFPDKWLATVLATPRHPGLMGLLDSCYMWRRGGGLERVREKLLAEPSR
jgi:hypothetical protein